MRRRCKARAIPVARVLSSRWCRCLETAQIAFGGAQAERALDNLFGRGENRERQLAAFRRLVAAAPAAGNLVLVTHGSTTLAFTSVERDIIRGFLAEEFDAPADNAAGYSQRFGIVWVDIEDEGRRRIVKDSGWWLRDLIAGAPLEYDDAA